MPHLRVVLFDAKVGSKTLPPRAFRLLVSVQVSHICVVLFDANVGTFKIARYKDKACERVSCKSKKCTEQFVIGFRPSDASNE